MIFLVAKFFKTLSFIVTHLPRGWQRGLGDLFGLIWFDLFRIRRKIAIENVKLAFPEIQDREAIELARSSCRNWGRTLVEYCQLPFLDSDWDREEFVEVRGSEFFWRESQKGKGVLLLSLHLGNGDLGCAALSRKNFPLYLISKEFKMGWLNDLWYGMRRRYGTSFIAPEKSSYEILKALKNKAGVIFVLDQFTGPPMGVEVTFFGKRTGAAQGLALFALKAGLDVIPVYSYRDKSGKLIITFEEGIPIQEGQSRQETIERMTQVYTDKVEELVRRYPDQWMWIHRRWKEFKH